MSGLRSVWSLIGRVRVAPEPPAPRPLAPADGPSAPPTPPRLAAHAPRFVELERAVWDRFRPQVRDAVQAALDTLATVEDTTARPHCCGQPMRRHD